MATLNKTSFDVHNFSDVIHQNPPPVDFQDFIDWAFHKEYYNTILMCANVNISCGFFFGLFYVLLLSTVCNKEVRGDSRMWGFYHLMAIITFITLIVHLAAFPVQDFMMASKNLCFFLHYSTDYALMATSVTVVIINVDFYLTTIFPVRVWRTGRIFRFVVMTLTSWLYVCLVVTHVVIAGNRAVSQPSGTYCFYADDATILTRNIFFNIIPGFCVILLSILITFTHARKVFPPFTVSGEMNAGHADKETRRWFVCVAIMNIMFVISMSLHSIMIFNRKVFQSDLTRKKLILIVTFQFLFSASYYLMPMGVLSLPAVRHSVKMNCFKMLNIVTIGKFRLGETDVDLAVHYNEHLHDAC